MTVASLVDTNILVYRFDARFPRKRQIATELLRTGIAQGSLRVPPPDTGNMTSRCDRHALETR